MTVEGRRIDDLDTKRTAALTLFGGLYSGGALHVLYGVFPRAASEIGRISGVPALRNSSSMAHTGTIAMIDNVHCGALYIPTYFIAVGALQGHPHAEVQANLRSEWATTYASCSAFWIPYTFVNFAYVSARNRVKFVAVGNLAWSVAIDYLAHRNQGAVPDVVAPRQECLAL